MLKWQWNLAAITQEGYAAFISSRFLLQDGCALRHSVLVPLSPSPIPLTHRVSFPLVSLSARHIEQGQQQQPDGDRGGGGGGLHVESPSRRRSQPLTEEPRRTTKTASAPSQLGLASFPPAAPKSLPHTCHGKPSEWMTVCLVGWSVGGCHFAQAVTKCSRVSRRTSPLFNYSQGLERPSKSSPKVCAPQQESTTSSAQHGRGH